MTSAKNADSGASTRSNPYLFYLLVIVAIVSFMGAIALSVNHIRYRTRVTESTKERLQQITVDAAQEIGKTINETIRGADSIAKALTTGDLTEKQFHAQLQQALSRNPFLYGCGIAFEPHGFKPEQRLFAPYYKKNQESGEIELVMIDEIYDYTLPENEWYATAVSKGKPWWVESFWGEASQEFLTSYSAVFYKTDPSDGSQKPAGVVIFTISMDNIKQLIDSLDLGPSGFGGLISQKGIYLYHPNNDYVVSRKNITDVAKEKNDEDRFFLAEQALKKEKGIIEHTSTTTKQESWLAYAPVPTIGWSLQNTFLKDDVPIDVDKLRHQLFYMILVWLIFLSASGSLASRLHRGNTQGIWGVSITASFFIMLGVGLLWTMALLYNPVKKNGGVNIFDKNVLQKVVNEHTNRSKLKHLPTPVFVPTGIFIESIKFSEQDNISLSGYIWQKYDASFPKNVKKTVTFSKATNISIKEAARQSTPQYEIIKYYFEAGVQQNFTHKKYPLEQEVIDISIIREEQNNNIVLIPDITSYEVLSSCNLPGIDSDTFLTGWKLTNSFFQLRKRDLKSSFGLDYTTAMENHPDLHYCIKIERNFLDAFISNLTPLIIVAIMLFFLLMLSNHLDAAQVFSICVAMFFVIVFSHIDIRRKIAAGEIFYLEYFYFLTYWSILYVSINSVGIMLKSNFFLFRLGNDLIPRASFWPTINGLIFLVTFFTFY